MYLSKKTGLIIAVVVVVALFLYFGGGALSSSFMGGGTRGGVGMMGGDFLGYRWMLVPTLITLAAGVLLGWLLFGRRR